MLIKKICPDCCKHWATHEGTFTDDKVHQDTLTICCPTCHAKRQAKIAAINAMYPSSDELGLVGSISYIPTERWRRPHQSGRQINHKSEHRAG